MEWPLPRACALDLIEAARREGWSMSKMANSLGICESGFRHLLNKAQRKVRKDTDPELARELAEPNGPAVSAWGPRGTHTKI
jgi:hypothetical protein